MQEWRSGKRAPPYIEALGARLSNLGDFQIGGSFKKAKIASYFQGTIGADNEINVLTPTAKWRAFPTKTLPNISRALNETLAGFFEY